MYDLDCDDPFLNVIHWHSYTQEYVNARVRIYQNVKVDDNMVSGLRHDLKYCIVSNHGGLLIHILNCTILKVLTMRNFLASLLLALGVSLVDYILVKECDASKVIYIATSPYTCTLQPKSCLLTNLLVQAKKMYIIWHCYQKEYIVGKITDEEMEQYVNKLYVHNGIMAIVTNVKGTKLPH